jgi:hypothetical protein
MVATTCPETLLPSYQNVQICTCSSVTSSKCVVQGCGIMRLASDKFVVHSMVPLSWRVYNDTEGVRGPVHFQLSLQPQIKRNYSASNETKKTNEKGGRRRSGSPTRGSSKDRPSHLGTANNGSSYRLISPTSNLTGRSLFLYLCKDVQLLRPENGWDGDSKIYWARSRDHRFWWHHFTTLTFLVGWICYRLLKDRKSYLFCLFVCWRSSVVCFLLVFFNDTGSYVLASNEKW